MRLLDARRLTGVSLDLDAPGAIAEVAFDLGDDVDAAITCWREHITEALRLLGWDAAIAVRRFHGGAALAFTAPRDALYLAVDITEWAVDAVIRRLRREPVTPAATQLPAWRAARAREHLPALARLQAEADARGLPLLLDDDQFSLGAGRGARTWPRAEPPAFEHVPWDSLAGVPIALITGTNGKTTTARLLAAIAKAAGHVPGNTSTDGLTIDGRIVEEGDWTGPGAARIVLRDPRVTFAVLELARGGILRRGLAVDRCDAACITNVSADHLGEYGIDDLAAMARVKAVVTRAVRPGGRIVLGADSPPLLDLPHDAFPAPVVWFALDPDHPKLREHRARGGEVYFLAPDGHLTRGRGDIDEPLVPVAELPVCFGGAAVHNVRNALAAAALAGALGLPDPAIAAGLRSFTANPGRAQLLHLDGVQLFLDFAHNPEGIAGLAPLFARLRASPRELAPARAESPKRESALPPDTPPPARLLVSLGVAGDRRDDDIRDIARAVAALGPDLVLTRDLDHYLRGRAPGEVPALLEKTFAALGIPCERVAGEVAAICRGLAWARPGDLLAILVHVERDEVRDELRARGLVP